MSLYGSKAVSKSAGPKSVWPYFFLSLSALFIAVMVCIIYWPKNVPAFEDLVMTGGKMRTLMIRDDLSDTGAGAMLPIFTSAYLRFKDIEGEFRYPWTFPQYGRVRTDTAVFVEIWVEKAALERDGAPYIWALRENNPYKEADEQTIVLYEDLQSAQQKNGMILLKLSLIMAGAAIVFAIIGVGVGRWNRRKYPDYYS